MESSITYHVDLDLRYKLYGNNGFFIDPFVINMSIVDDVDLNMSYNEIKEFVKNASINLKENEIKKYLNDRMNKEHPGLRKRLIDERNYNEDDESHIKKIQDQNIASLYYFEPYSLHYFKKYVSILRQKCLDLIKIIDDLNNMEDRETLNRVKKKMALYDLHINHKDEIYYLDAVRIEETFVYNFKDLYKKVIDGNNLETYYTFKLSKSKLLKECVFESNLYPKKELQIKDLRYSFDKQFIALSPNQEKDIINQARQDWISDETINDIDYNHTLRRTKK